MNLVKNYPEAALEIYNKMFKIRHFELNVAEAHKQGAINVPIYLSIGQESIAATLATFFSSGIPIFGQHRAHSYFLAFGGDMRHLRSELLSENSIWSQGSGGSASISSKDIGMFGHGGLMGDQVPIAIGYSLATSNPVLTVVGDASAEEDYVLSAIGYAVKRNLPVIMVCEDNNLSILTEKSVRRDWELHEVALSYGASAFDIEDEPEVIWKILMEWNKADVLVLNVRTERHYWHAGSGQDKEPTQDRLAELRSNLFNSGFDQKLLQIEANVKMELSKLWT